MKRRNGITLLEIVFAITLIVFLMSAVSFVYIVSLRGWASLGHHSDLHEKLHFGLERMIRDVRQANAVVVANHSLRFTVNENGVDNTYLYYLHNPLDTWVPAYNQPTYDLRRVSVGGGPFVYGSGELIITGLKSPTDTTITSVGNTAIIAFAGQDHDDRLTVRGYVHPRNL